MTRTEELLALAEAVTPGPWKVGGKRMSYMAKKLMYSVEGPSCVSDYEDWGYTKESAKFIAAANPETIKQLVELVRLQHEALNTCQSMAYHNNDGVSGDVCDKAIAAFNKFEGGE